MNIENIRAIEAMSTEERDKLIASVFADPAASKLLDWWEYKFVYRAIAEAHSTDIEIGIRQGESNFVRNILAGVRRNGRS